MKSFPAYIGCLLLASCGIYSSKFDCPPGKGVGCAPVGEILDLIIEKESGEDLFVKDKGTALLLKQQKKEQEEAKEAEPKAAKLYLVKTPAASGSSRKPKREKNHDPAEPTRPKICRVFWRKNRAGRSHPGTGAPLRLSRPRLFLRSCSLTASMILKKDFMKTRAALDLSSK